MSSISDLDRKANITGSLWMIASMAAFAIEDSFFKTLAQTMPIGQVLMLFGFGGACFFAATARVTRQPIFVPEVLSVQMGIRAVFEVIGRLFYILAVALIPLSTATVILQATPLVVVAGASILFGEQVGWRRWSAIIIGLIGVVIIIQPGAEGFSMLSLLAVIGMFGLAGRDLASRAAPASISTTLFGFYGFLTVIIAGALYGLWQGAAFIVPNLTESLYLLGALGAGVFAYSALMKAMRTGEVSAVTPFRYTRLLFGIALGLLFFRESLSLSMMIGSALIVTSGLFILWRGKKRRPA